MEVTSSCIVTQLLQVLLIRLGLYLLNSPAVVLDLVAYTGYQCVCLDFFPIPCRLVAVVIFCLSWRAMHSGVCPF